MVCVESHDPNTGLTIATAKFGFFDLDATFTVAFISLLAVCLSPPGSRAASSHDGVIGAYEILSHFAAHGNAAASKRMVDVEQMCENLGIQIGHPKRAPSGQYGEYNIDEVDAVHGDRSWSAQQDGMSMAGHELDDPTFLDQSLPEHLDFEDASLANRLAEEGNSLGLTGVIDMDWEMLLQPNLCGNSWDPL